MLRNSHRFRSSSVFAIISLFFAAASCSTAEKSPGSPESNLVPDRAPIASQPDLETIAILGTNDLHGALAPQELKTRDPQGVKPTTYEAGGAAYLASYVDVLRSELGSRLIWLDAGDEYQGTIESNPNRGAAMVKFLSDAGVTAAAVGNHEFDFGAEPPDTADRLGSLKHRMSEARFPYLAANIDDASSDEPASFPNTLPHLLINAGRVKVGIIGLSTVDTPRTTRAENVATLKFGPLKEATLREAKALREEGARIVVITAHAGLSCEPGRSPQGDLLRRPGDMQGLCVGGNQEITALLSSLPRGTVDAVVSGHTHTVVHHWIDGVPVIQAGASGRYFNVIYLTYDLAHERLLTDRTRIEGPVPVCPKIFKNQGDCNGDRPAPREGRGRLVSHIFHRITISANREVESILGPTFAAAKKAKEQVFGEAARPIDHERFGESPMGDLVADALREETKSDFALINTGGIRAPFQEGPITYGEIFATLPFDNTITVLRLTGKQIRTLIQVAESGSRGFPPISGLQLKLIHPDVDAPSRDLNGDKKIEPWEINRLIEVRLADGSPLQDRKEYTLATIDFLVSGGDDLGWIMSRLPTNRKSPTGIMMRDAVTRYIRRIGAQGPINAAAHPLVDPAHPRLIFDKTDRTKVKKRRHRHRRAQIRVTLELWQADACFRRMRSWG